MDGAIGNVMLLVEGELNDDNDDVGGALPMLEALVSVGRDAANAAARLTPVSRTFSSGVGRGLVADVLSLCTF
jgi:hypothetical protein